jgi:hypothetical protein
MWLGNKKNKKIMIVLKKKKSLFLRFIFTKIFLKKIKYFNLFWWELRLLLS